ncbi:MAG: oligosaccharide flippase family protein [Candidatus Omnitrophica bacterium]|nr:oligosaccharide flippase family protein [Candidatus Omnitrophota bacterium]
MTGKDAKKERLSHGIIKNILWNFIGQAWMFGLAFFATPFIVRALNVDLYAIYALVSVVVGYFAFLQLGLGAASIKYVASYLNTGQEDEVRRTFWSCLAAHGFLGLIGMLAIISSARFFTDTILKIPADLRGVCLFALIAASAGFFISMVLGSVSAIIQAAGRFDLLNRIGIALGSLQVSVTVILLKLGYSLKEVVVANVAVQALGVCLYWISAKNLFPFLARPAWDPKALVKLLRFGGFVTISSVTTPIFLNIEKIFLASLRSISNLTYYSVPFALTDRLSVIRSSFSTVLFPAFSRLDSAHEKEASRELYYRSALYILFLYAFFVLFLATFGRSFLAVWIGEDFAERSAAILVILAVAVLVNAMAGPSLNILQGVGKPHIPAAFHIIEVIFYVPLAYILIRKFGGTGAALAFLARALLDTALLHKAAAVLFGEGLFAWYLRLFRRSFAPVFVCGLLLWWLKNFSPYILHPLTIGGLIAAFVVYAYIIWQWGLDDFARERARSFLKGLPENIMAG